MREKTLHYGYAYLFSPIEIRRIGERAGLRPVAFASSISPPDVWLPGYPAVVRWPAQLEFRLHRMLGYAGGGLGMHSRNRRLGRSPSRSTLTEVAASASALRYEF